MSNLLIFGLLKVDTATCSHRLGKYLKGMTLFAHTRQIFILTVLFCSDLVVVLRSFIAF